MRKQPKSLWEVRERRFACRNSLEERQRERDRWRRGEDLGWADLVLLLLWIGMLVVGALSFQLEPHLPWVR